MKLNKNVILFSFKFDILHKLLCKGGTNITTNQKTPNPNILYIWCGAAILVLAVIAALFPGKRKMPDIDRELAKLSPTKTAADLEKMGYVDLTQVQPAALEDVDAFFRNNNFNELMLKTFTETEDGLIVRAFLYYRNANFIQMFAYNVQEQKLLGNPSVNMQLDRVETADGITEVWLRGYRPDDSVPDPMDFLLYRFTTPQ